MASKTKKPAAGGTATGLPMSVIPGGTDITEVTLRPLEIQASRIVQRFGFSIPVARVVAEHTFAVGGLR